MGAWPQRALGVQLPSPAAVRLMLVARRAEGLQKQGAAG